MRSIRNPGPVLIHQLTNASVGRPRYDRRIEGVDVPNSRFDKGGLLGEATAEGMAHRNDPRCASDKALVPFNGGDEVGSMVLHLIVLIIKGHVCEPG
jgi:hypothetical protein